MFLCYHVYSVRLTMKSHSLLQAHEASVCVSSNTSRLFDAPSSNKAAVLTLYMPSLATSALKEAVPPPTPK